ncbi:MAG: hypothetical protein V3U64_00265 [Cocleimonas sp.]
MKSDVSKSEIDNLEKVLSEFRMEWENSQSERAKKWRVNFFLSFIVTLGLSLYSATFWWLGVAVIAYFAGALYSLLRLNAKTNSQIIEHQQQLKLVRLLRKFQTSPYSQEDSIHR